MGEMLEIVRVIRVLMGKKNNTYQKKGKKNNRTWRKKKGENPRSGMLFQGYEH